MSFPPLRRPGGAGERAGSSSPWVEATPISSPEITPPGREGSGPAVEGFLEVLRIAVGAFRVALWRRDGESWWLEREAVEGQGAVPRPVGPLDAAGHAFTWALKEGLQLQVRSEEIFSGAGGWSLVGGPAGSGRVLCISFEGTPGATARPSLGPALRHLRALHRAEARPSSGGGGAPRAV